MLIDVHSHAFHPKIAPKVLARLEGHYGIPAQGDGTIEDLLARARRAGLDKVVVFTAAMDPSQVTPANDWALELGRAHPEVIPFGTMHPEFRDPEAELARLEENGIRGIKFHADFQGFRLDDPGFYKIMEMVAGRFIVMLHVGDALPPEKNPSCPIKAARLLDDFPRAEIIAAHMGGYLHWKWSLEHLAGREVWFDTSSTLGFIDQATLEELFRRHPKERILFGSDYPLFSPGQEIEKLARRLGLGDAELEDLMAAASGLLG
ncbi:MAG: amidohydrolase family protein [Desulfovibrionaceae bacterium]|nr:amidohydrolase [Desulfovibrionaceae bacterium]MDD4951212.1 amidohydrolase family protein [Desulfovibrionaceae bacterium]